MTRERRGRGGEAGIATDFRGRMSYGDYLDLERLLGAQRPLSEQHDEMLFIVIHHVQELWLKLLAHELRAAMARVRADDLPPAFKCLARVARIQEQMIRSWDVLSTMTPADYLSFRDRLGQASGFQSHQYRLVEFLLGNKDKAMLLPHRHKEAVHAELAAALAAPSLYDESLRLLARRGFALPSGVTARDFSQDYEAHPAVLEAWRAVYADTERYFDLYELAEELVDVEDWFQQWRFRHMKTVERIIGMRRGTGGSSGVPYLRRALESSFFPELWALRGEL